MFRCLDCQHSAKRGPARLVVLRCVASALVRATRLSQRTSLPSQWVTDQATDADQERWYAHLPEETIVLDTQQVLEASIAHSLSRRRICAFGLSGRSRRTSPCTRTPLARLWEVVQCQRPVAI
jgi:hypothetical protein